MLLSVAIITLNEERNLARTLASVQFADEVIVVDSGSTDRTLEIAREFGAKIYEEPWRGFAAQKNYAISLCSGEWVLSLDADEEVSPALADQLKLVLPSQTPIDAWMIPRRNMIFGRWIKRGGFYPDEKLRVFRRGLAQFSSRIVHETIAFDGDWDTLDGDLIHHAYPDLTDYIEHMNRYSSLGAELLVAEKKTSRGWFSFLWNVVGKPTIQFKWNYIFRFGFLDGREGLLLHLYHTAYTSWKYAKAWEAARQSGRSA